MNYSTMTLTELEKALRTGFDKGLSEKASSKGQNVIAVKKKAGFIRQLLSQMSDFMTIVLLSAAAASYFSTHMRGETDIFEPLLIVAIVLLNALLGVFQQRRAERAIDALKKLSSPTARVLRGGRWQNISAQNLAVGDIVGVKAGDRISADMRIIEAVSLEVDESSLTGESLPAEKTECVMSEPLPAAEQKNMLFSATSVTSGHAKCVVCAIGKDTEMGKIAGFIMNEDAEETPLQKKLSSLGKTLGIAALAICGIIFLIGLLKRLEPLDMFITAVSLAVAAIPEGLPATVTVVLAIGVERMAKKKAIVKRLSAVETLGTANVILTDKTGTLTENKMTVTDFWCENTALLKEVGYLASLGGENPTEAAILAWSAKTDGWKKLDETAFNSKRKMMSAFFENKDKKRIVAKGAAEILTEKCSHLQTKSGAVALDHEKRRALLSQANKMASQGLRTLAVAYADRSDYSEERLVFLGLVGISDPARREAKEAVSECLGAGIKVVMVTGDHSQTASAIAREVGIIRGDEKVVSGRELEAMTDSELAKNLPKIAVFSRVTPEQKLRIVKAYKKCGLVSAMTGDGVNDAPALKAADIGCSMGKCGTDVAKEASDMVLADDNFATIVAAVKEGRRIFSNIKKAVYFLLSSNIGELICVFFGVLFGFAAPLTPPQLLWINLVTDSLPAIALALDPAEADIMRKQKKDDHALFTRQSALTIIAEGAMIGAIALVAYTLGAIFFDKAGEIVIGRTMAFAVLACSQLVHSFNLRSERSVLTGGFFKNKALVLSFITGVLLTVLLIILPKTAMLFGVAALPSEAWLLCAAFSILPLIIVELAKKVESYFTEKNNNVGNF